MPAAVPEPSATLTARYRLDRVEDWEIFLRRLRRRDSFAFLPLFAPEDAGVEIARRALATWAEENSVPLVFHTLLPDGPADSLTRLLIDELENPDAIHWIQASPLDPGGDKETQLAARWHDPVAALNSRRNSLQQSLRAPLIFAAPEELSPYLRDHAVDLWDIRGISTYLPPPEAEPYAGWELQPIGSGLAIPGDPQFTTNLARDLEGQPDRAEERAALLSRAGRQALYHWNLPLAESLLRESLKLSKEIGSGPDILWSREDHLARLLRKSGQIAEAVVHAEEARALAESAHGPTSTEFAASLNNLAGMLQDQGNLDKAEQLARRSLKISEPRFGKDHPAIATCLNNLALVLQDRGKLTEAESLFRRALAIDESKLGEDHPDVATDLNNLAGLLLSKGKLAEAETLYRRALEISEAKLGFDHPIVAIRINNLADLLQAQGKVGDAVPLLQRAIEITEIKLGKEHPDVATSLSNLAVLLKAQGKFVEAQHLYRRALRIAFSYLKRNHTQARNQEVISRNYAILLEETHHSPGQIQAELANIREEAGLND
jgi:tetratricopeptide (TPR) repeat protein